MLEEAKAQKQFHLTAAEPHGTSKYQCNPEAQPIGPLKLVPNGSLSRTVAQSHSRTFLALRTLAFMIL